MGGGVSAQRESSFAGAGGLEIFWRAWLPDGDARAAVVIAHGAGEHSGRYAHVAQRLVDEGYAVYAIEHRGHGRSQGPRALIDRIDNAVADLDKLVVLAADSHPGVPLFLLGHSMGGTIALSYTLAHQQRLTGLVLSGPLAALEAVPAPLRMTARTLSVLAPRTPLIAIDASLVSRDPAVVGDYQSDPLVHHGKLPARTVVELADAIEAFPEAVGGDHRADADHVRDRRRPLPAAGQRDAVAANRLVRQDAEALSGPLPRDPQRARARAGPRRPPCALGCRRGWLSRPARSHRATTGNR